MKKKIAEKKTKKTKTYCYCVSEAKAVQSNILKYVYKRKEKLPICWITMLF